MICKLWCHTAVCLLIGEAEKGMSPHQLSGLKDVFTGSEKGKCQMVMNLITQWDFDSNIHPTVTYRLLYRLCSRLVFP